MANRRVFAFLALAAVSLASAQDVRAADDDTIVVTGERLAALRDFVGQVSSPAWDENQMSRWNRHICPSVAGFTDREHDQFVVDRIALRAHAVGLRVDGPGCRADVMIIVTPDPSRVAHVLRTEFGRVLGTNPDYNTHTRTGEDLAAFESTTRPVRWWHVTQTVTADGFNIKRVSANSSEARPQIRVFSPSRLHRTTRLDFSRVVILVDARQAAGRRFDALADYLAMVTLAQLSPDTDTASYPSILNLFSSNEPMSGMTSWDISYLQGLYHMTRAARNAPQQEAEIARYMLRNATPAAEPAP